MARLPAGLTACGGRGGRAGRAKRQVRRPPAGLRRAKGRYDPGDLLRSGHAIQPAA
jgi:hypothetical protein